MGSRDCTSSSEMGALLKLRAEDHPVLCPSTKAAYLVLVLAGDAFYFARDMLNESPVAVAVLAWVLANAQAGVPLSLSSSSWLLLLSSSCGGGFRRWPRC